MQANGAMLAAYGIEGCGCTQCVGKIISARPWPKSLYWPFIVCSECGNKRCPKANYHGNVCTGSNEPGQPGSSYPLYTREESEKAIREFLG